MLIKEFESFKRPEITNEVFYLGTEKSEQSAVDNQRAVDAHATPIKLKKAIEEQIEAFGVRHVVEAREELTDRYRKQQKKKQPFMTTDAHRLSYLATRLPATYASVHYVLEEIKARLPSIEIKTILDLGAGPGTGMWVASEVFSTVEKITLVEKDASLIRLGKRLASYHENPAVQQADWQLGDLESIQTLPLADLVVLSYSIGELNDSSIQSLLDQCWSKTGQILAIIEPGTPVGFERVRLIRRHLISIGSYMVAPCPHTVACPMTQGDWCHFSERVERSSLHRRLKEGTLGYEDEKFSYVAVSKTSCVLPLTRVLRHPLKRSGHVSLTLCSSEGIEHKTVSKRDPESYKIARKLEWGSPFSFFPE